MPVFPDVVGPHLVADDGDDGDDAFCRPAIVVAARFLLLLTFLYLVDRTHYGFHETRLLHYKSYILSLSLSLTIALHYLFPHSFALSHTLGTLSHK